MFIHYFQTLWYPLSLFQLISDPLYSIETGAKSRARVVPSSVFSKLRYKKDFPLPHDKWKAQ